jgi:hypothetical protein
VREKLGSRRGTAQTVKLENCESGRTSEEAPAFFVGWDMATRTDKKRRAAGAAKGRGGKAKQGQWTKEKEEKFFRELAMVCNVTAALRAAGMMRSGGSVYDRRKRDPEFKTAWDEAICESYALLELEMLERGRFGDNRPPPKSETEKRLREIPTALGLSLLKIHAGRVRGRSPSAQRPMRGAKLRDELEARLSVIG